MIVKALVKVSSTNSKGRARIIKATHVDLKNSALWSDPRYLTSKLFTQDSIKFGDLLIIAVEMRERSRLVTSIIETLTPMAITDAIRYFESSAVIESVTVSWGSDLTASITSQREVRKEDKLQQPTRVEVAKSPVVDGNSTFAYINDDDLKLFQSIKSISTIKHVGVLMIGPSGYGKTTIPQSLASRWGMDFLRWDCSTIRDPEEFFGYRAAINGSTANEEGESIFLKTQFTEMIEAGNCVIVLDELNRIDPYISNALFPLLDHAGKTLVAGHEIVVGPNVIFFATINVGYQFTGTFTLDIALTNRFIAKVIVGVLPKDVEARLIVDRSGLKLSEANEIVRKFTLIRVLNERGELNVDVSTRTSLQVADLMMAGLSFKEALVYTVINGLEDNEVKLIVDATGI